MPSSSSIPFRSNNVEFAIVPTTPKKIAKMATNWITYLHFSCPARLKNEVVTLNTGALISPALPLLWLKPPKTKPNTA